MTPKLVFVTGKGGVGKTTVSLALALKGAREGAKVLCLSIQAPNSLPPYFQKSNLSLLDLEPKQSFEEYVVSQIRSRTLYRALFEHQLVQNFIEGTPGLSDLMIIGKIYSLQDQYDQIIVDAPATGHSLSLLKIAGIVSRAVRVGPLRSQAEAIDRLLHDPKKTSLVLVTLPEELPFQEACDLSDELRKLGYSIAAVCLNQTVLPPLDSEEKKEWDLLGQKEEAVFYPLRLEIARAERSTLYRKELKRQFSKIPLLELPFSYSQEFGLEEVEKFSEKIWNPSGKKD